MSSKRWRRPGTGCCATKGSDVGVVAGRRAVSWRRPTCDRRRLAGRAASARGGVPRARGLPGAGGVGDRPPGVSGHAQPDGLVHGAGGQLPGGGAVEEQGVAVDVTRCRVARTARADIGCGTGPWRRRGASPTVRWPACGCASASTMRTRSPRSPDEEGTPPVRHGGGSRRAVSTCSTATASGCLCRHPAMPRRPWR